jgi:hypothetical protein
MHVFFRSFASPIGLGINVFCVVNLEYNFFEAKLIFQF